MNFNQFVEKFDDSIFENKQTVIKVGKQIGGYEIIACSDENKYLIVFDEDGEYCANTKFVSGSPSVEHFYEDGA